MSPRRVDAIPLSHEFRSEVQVTFETMVSAVTVTWRSQDGDVVKQ